MEFNIDVFTDYLAKYGVITIFIVVFLEYLNLPGFPAGVIMPLSGIWIYQGGINFFFAYVVSILAGLCGSWVLYLIGFYGGSLVITKYTNRFPKHKERIEKVIHSIERKAIWEFYWKADSCCKDPCFTSCRRSKAQLL